MCKCEWRDIQSAPKDGTVILGFLMDGDGVALIQWAEGNWNGDGWVHATGKWSAFATHWQPLPPAPGEQAGEPEKMERLSGRDEPSDELVEAVARTMDHNGTLDVDDDAPCPYGPHWFKREKSRLREDALNAIRAYQKATAEKEKPMKLNDEQIKHMVDRFLAWRLPTEFHPDAGISFNPEFNVEYNANLGKPPSRHEPTGTNLFDVNQATEMVRHMIEGLPDV